MSETVSLQSEGMVDLELVRRPGVLDALRRMRPWTREDLRNYVKVFLGIAVPDRGICPGHSSPMDYLWHSFAIDDGLWMKDDSGQSVCSVPVRTYPPVSRASLRQTQGRLCPRFEGGTPSTRTPYGVTTNALDATPQRATRDARRATVNADCIVWANRAGGKTQLAAVATLLDVLFKPQCQVRILGGSGEQSSRMYDYLARFLREGFGEALAGPVRKGKCRFTNGSAVEIMTQSATCVRGQHVQKLRCDEVELFDEDVFAAAKFTTLSKHGIRGAMELISTMHRPYGIMQREVAAAAGAGVPVFKWCLWETIERCVGRSCSQCPLSEDCQGKAKSACGYLGIDDCITQIRRSSRAGWEAEMLCIRPSLENVVFGEFDPAIHVRPADYDANLPLYRTLDFGFVNPFVCLWVQADHDGTVRVIDEYVRSRATIDAHAREVKARTPCPEERVAATFCDPAGAGSNDVTGTSAIRELRGLGIATRYRKSGILEGIEMIRRAIRSGDGKSSLVISPRCPRLIEALQCYHYPDSARAGELPFKDGLYDHPIDALRYFFVNHAPAPTATTRRY